MKTPFSPKLLIILGILVLLNSCDTLYYYPTNQNVLCFKEKGDVNAALGLNGYCSYSNLGYSITDNIAVVSDYKTFGITHSDDKYKTNTFLWDNEIIIYKKWQEYLYPAINMGYGFGQINRNDTNYRLDIFRQFIQPSFGVSTDFFDFAISAKFSRVNYDLEKFYASNTKIYDFGDVGKKDFYFSEPAITVGWI